MIGSLLTFLLFSFFFYHLFWKRKSLPKGPIPLPFLGNLHLFNESVKPGYDVWKQLSKQYGSVFTFWMAHMPVIVVTEWELIKQHFIKDGSNFTGRPEFPAGIEIRKGPYGIVESYGDRWMQQRRFALHVLRNFGLGKNLMEEKVISELQSLIENLKKNAKNGKIDMENYIDASIGSVINNLLFGYRYDETNMEEFITLKNKLSLNLKLASGPIGGLISMYPILGRLPYFRTYKKTMFDNWNALFDLFKLQIAEKEKIIDYDMEEYSDIVEAFLKERKKHEDAPNFGGFEHIQLENVCFDLWLAGMETTANTLYFAFLYVILNPEVKEKIYAELDLVIGGDRIVRSSDRSQLNYINATINESQRMANLLPLNLLRVTTADVEIAGNYIPKGSVVVPQISAVMYNEEIFPEPHTFKPERFLDSDGKLKKVEEFVPFSIGKRQCLGEGLARLELFIFFANIFNQFDISLDSSSPIPSIDKEYGVTVRANKYTVSINPRF